MIVLGALFWTTTTPGSIPPTPPLPPTNGSSGGDSQWTPPGWLLDMLEDEERLAAEAKKLKKEIKAVAKRKAEVQAQLAKPSQAIDYGALVAIVMDLQQRLQALLDSYRVILKAIEDIEEDREGEELMELLAAYQGGIQ